MHLILILKKMTKCMLEDILEIFDDNQYVEYKYQGPYL